MIRALLRLIVLGTLAAGWALADNRLPDKPVGPQSLPGDNLPPFFMLNSAGKLVDVIPESFLKAAGAHGAPNAPPESTARGPSLDLALEAARTALDACTRLGYRVGVAVVDSVGEARATMTADGADGSHVFVAQRKALTALGFNMQGTQVQALWLKSRDPKMLAHMKPSMFVMGGAVPLTVGNELVGAIGVSGAGGGPPPGHVDEGCAIAGRDKIQGRLK